MQQVLITGGTGTIGKALTKELVAKGFQVMIVSRSKKEPGNGIRYYTWNIDRMEIEEEAIQKADFIIHLAGAGVADKRWTTTRKKEIITSRVQSCQLLVHALQTIPNQVKAVISASAIGWYGPDKSDLPEKGFEETAPAYPDFLGDTCKQWETAISPVERLGKRLVILRTGIVLSTAGGAFKEFLQPVKYRIATVLGNGKQWISWIHIQDLCNQYISAIANPNISGVYNAVAPYPVTNEQLINRMATHLFGNKYIRLFVPAFMLKFMLGEMSIEILKSTRVSADKILHTGFRFLFPSVEEALENLLPTTNPVSDASGNKSAK